MNIPRLLAVLLILTSASILTSGQVATANLDGACSSNSPYLVLSMDFPQYPVTWATDEASFELRFKDKFTHKKPAPCVDKNQNPLPRRFLVVPPGATAPHGTTVNPVCYVNPQAKKMTEYKYTIYWISPLKPSQKVKCNDPKVIVSDGAIMMHQLQQQTEGPVSKNGVCGNVTDQEVMILPNCQPRSATVNLCLKQQNTLHWAPDGFTISFDSGKGPCLDESGHPQDSFKSVDDPAGPNPPLPKGNTCYPSSSASGDYTYKVTGTYNGQPCSRTGVVNVGP